MRNVITICAFAAIVLTMVGLSQAAVLNVKPAPGGVRTKGDVYPSIQAAIDDAGPGDTITIHPGTYDENLNIDGKTNLTIAGVNKTTTILKSSTTRSWAIPGYPQYDGRRTVVRIYNSSVTTITNMTIDCDLIKGDTRYGVTGWDSDVTVNNCILKNISVPDTMSGGLSEVMSYFRAVSFTDTSRAAVNITGNTFIDAGRVGIVTHDYILADISGNTFYKTFNDFGYALELGSMSKGSITDNIIYGYDTPAITDNSSAAGLYIENSFTNGITTPITKNVLLQDNEIYDCQYVMTVGNEWDGYAGDVDIVLTMQGNNFHNNVSGGIIVADEDKEAGSSVTINGSGNTIVDNNEFGYFIYTFGDGDITVNLSGETISGHGYGMYVGDYPSGPSGSSYSVTINGSKIRQNSDYGIDNEVASFIVNAKNNWWGYATGPYHPTSNPAGQGNAVSDNVDYEPWYTSGLMSDKVIVKIGSTEEIRAYSDTIQGGIDAAFDGDTVVVSEGTYPEAIVIDKAVTLQGAGCDITTIDATGAAADIAVDIQQPGGSVTFNGFTVKAKGIAYPTWTFAMNVVSNTAASTITVTGSRFEGTGDPINYECGIYVHGTSAAFVFQHNTVTKGGGNPILIEKNPGATDVSYNALDAGSYGMSCFYMTYGGTNVTTLQKFSNNTFDMGTGEAFDDDHRVQVVSFTGAFWNTLGTGGYSNIEIKNNRFYNGRAYCRGVGLFNDSTNGTDGLISGAVIKNNIIEGTGAETASAGIRLGGLLTDITITNNNISGMADGILGMVGPYGVHYPDNVMFSYNSVVDNTMGANWPVEATLLDASYNWWGDMSGPNDPIGTMETDGKNCYDVSVIVNADGLGDAVTENVIYCPWLLVPIISSDGPCPAGDLDGDCDVDFNDFAILANNWLVGTEG